MDDYISNGNNLPPGFRFCPTDEELIVHFLQRKVSLLPCDPDIIPDLDLYPYDPWDLDGKALAEGNNWYFYSRRTQNRTTESGYWKSLGSDETIFDSGGSQKVGVKKYYMFYTGDQSESPEGKTNWVMQEFRLSDSASTSRSSSKRRGHSKDYSRWVICRVYEQNDDGNESELSCLDEVFLSMDNDFDEIGYPN
ncbi:hypothetical protein LguiA_008616 [Lonicera macranthoides]